MYVNFRDQLKLFDFPNSKDYSFGYNLQFEGIQIKHFLCVKSVRIRSYSGPHFPAFGLNISLYSVQIQENADQNKSEYGHFSRLTTLLKCSGKIKDHRYLISRLKQQYYFAGTKFHKFWSYCQNLQNFIKAYNSVMVSK